MPPAATTRTAWRKEQRMMTKCRDVRTYEQCIAVNESAETSSVLLDGVWKLKIGFGENTGLRIAYEAWGIKGDGDDDE